MSYRKQDFTPFSVDSGRVIANLESAYEQWLDTRQLLNAMPVSMFWKATASAEYLAVKETSNSAGTTFGIRSLETEKQYQQFHAEKAELKQRLAKADELISQRSAQYRALRLPVLPDRQGEILVDACRYFLRDTYPMDIDFVLGLPAELRELFNEWAAASRFDPLAPAAEDNA
jgi:hypothetical protein